MAKNVATILGVVFLIAGLMGFIAPTMMGMHLTPTHNIVHIVSGLIALYYGLKGRNVKAAKNFLMIFGAVYGLLGVVGFLMGAGTPNVPPMVPDTHVLRLIPNHLELGTADSAMHLLLGFIALIAGVAQRTEREGVPGTSAGRAKSAV
jgi:uncharacterized membrane protein HdeD (DUF308 family)